MLVAPQLQSQNAAHHRSLGFAHPTPACASRYGTLVAAKILKGSNEIALGDFRGEIEILRRVHHPNAVQVGSLQRSPGCQWPVVLAARAIQHNAAVSGALTQCGLPLNAVQFLGACTKKEPYILVTELMSGGSLADAFRRPQARRGCLEQTTDRPGETSSLACAELLLSGAACCTSLALACLLSLLPPTNGGVQVFPTRRAVEIALDAARGLAYLHHRFGTGWLAGTFVWGCWGVRFWTPPSTMRPAALLLPFCALRHNLALSAGCAGSPTPSSTAI